MFQFRAFIIVASLLFCHEQIHAQQPLLHLPFDDGYVSQCVQGVNGSTTHQESATRYDLDLDTSNTADENVRAPTSGFAYVHMDPNNFGNHVNIDIGDSRFVILGHLREIVIQNGQPVHAGQYIGKEGCTGLCFGDHVHFGLHAGDATLNAVNSISIPMERIAVIDVGDGLVRELRGEDFICDLSVTIGHRYRTINKELWAGLFFDGWHTDGVSQSFLDAYSRFQLTGGNLIGVPFDNGGSEFVHEWEGALVQDFNQPDASLPRFGSGQTMLVYAEYYRRAHLIRDGFWWHYLNNRGPFTYGTPVHDEWSWYNEDPNIPGISVGLYSRQDFSSGYTLLWSFATGVMAVPTASTDFVLSDPPDYVIAAGGSEPLTLDGWALSKTQTYLRWSGGFGADSTSRYAIFQNGIEVGQTTLNEATFTGLASGQSYVYRVSLVDSVYGILDVSNDKTIALAGDEFSLVLTRRSENSFNVRIVNDRHPSAIGYAIYRNGVEVARTAGDTYSDFGLAYSSAYIYHAAALTASNLVLGWTPYVSVMTESMPQGTPTPPPAPAPSNVAAPFAAAQFAFVEPAPYVVNGFATATLLIQVIGSTPVTVDRFMVIGSFTDPFDGQVYTRNWRAVEFSGGFTMNPGDTYRYQMLNTGQAFPGIPVNGLLRAYVKVTGIAGQFEITQGLAGVAPTHSFAVENLPPPARYPNLVIDQVDVMTTSPDSDTDIVLNVMVSNNDQQYSPASRLSVMVDGTEHTHVTVPELAGVSECLQTVNLGSLTSGTHALVCVADSEMAIAESNETDNTRDATLTVTEALKPNLAVTLQEVDSLFINEDAVATFVVTNTGDQTAGPSQVIFGAASSNAFYQPGISLSPDKLIVEELAPGASSVISATLRVTGIDTYTLWVSADAANELSERDESDNTVSLEAASLNPPYTTITLTPAADTMITRDWINGSDTLHENELSDQFSVYTRAGINRHGRGLVRFDLPTLPAWSVIEGASLDLYALGQGEYKTNTFYVNLLTQSWDERYVTWLKCNAAQNWTTSGGAWSSAWQAQTVIPSAYATGWHNQSGPVNQRFSWDVSALVRAYYLGQAANHGFIVRQLDITNQSEGQSINFASLNHADTSLRPRLVIKYRAPTTVFSDSFDAGIKPEWFKNRSASGSVPFVAADSTPVAVGKPAVSGTHVLYMGDSTNGSYAKATMELDYDLTAFAEVRLEFDWAAYSLTSGRYIRLEVYNGAWQTLAQYSTQAWQHRAVDLTPYARTRPVTIRFSSYMDKTESQRAAYLDNIVLLGR